MPEKSGFTLIELLIAVSIVAILATIGLLVYGSFLRSARDAKRQADLKSIQSALEQYFADQVGYPVGSSSCTNGYMLQIINSSSCGLKNGAGTKTYMNVFPTDSLSSNPSYCYLEGPSSCTLSPPTCTTYTIYAKLENSPAGTYSCGGNSTYNYRVTPP